MKRRHLGLVALLISMILLDSSVFASEEIKPQTFQKFAKVAGFEKQYYQMINILVSNFQQGMVAGFMDGISKKDIPSDIKEKLKPIINNASQNLKTDFEKIFTTEIKFDDLVTNVYLPTYRKHFTETEMNELIKFYNSALGKKIAELTPSIMQDSSDKFNQLYGQKVQAMGGDLVYNEINQLISKAKEL